MLKIFQKLKERTNFFGISMIKQNKKGVSMWEKKQILVKLDGLAQLVAHPLQCISTTDAETQLLRNTVSTL